MLPLNISLIITLSSTGIGMLGYGKLEIMIETVRNSVLRR